MSSNVNNINQPESNHTTAEGNRLFPIFLKLEQLSLLIVGGGNVGLEKLSAILANAPATPVRLVAKHIKDEVRELAGRYPLVELFERSYEVSDVESVHLVIIAVNDPQLSACIRQDAHRASRLVNVADQPALCDFYLSSIVQKGNLKIAISTNGKSPTVAKRLKEMLQEALPADLDTLLSNMKQIRDRLAGDFSAKVKQLNEITSKLVEK